MAHPTGSGMSLPTHIEEWSEPIVLEEEDEAQMRQEWETAIEVGQPADQTAASAPAALRYRTEHLMNLTPVQVVQKLYDLAILGCKKGDRTLAQKSLTELISALNFEENELAVKLFGLYDYCKRCIRRGETDAAVEVLESLRSAWKEAFQLH